MESKHENPTAEDILALRGLIKGFYSGRDPGRFDRLSAWLGYCANTLIGEPLVFRRVHSNPDAWEIGSVSKSQIYHLAPRVMTVVHDAIAGRPVNVADHVKPQRNGYSPYPDNSLRNRIRDQALPWINARCARLRGACATSRCDVAHRP